MRKRTGIVATVLVAGALLAGGLQPTLAQDATPIVPDPSECVVEPRTVDNIVDLTMNGDYVPDPDIAAGKLPTGEPAPADAVAAIDATMRQFVACANNNDIPRMLALLTDNGAQYFLDFESTITEEQLRAMAAVPPSPVADDEREMFAPLLDAVLLPDGRIGGLVGTSSPGDAVYVIFKEQDGLWLGDEIIEISGAPATPES